MSRFSGSVGTQKQIWMLQKSNRNQGKMTKKKKVNLILVFPVAVRYMIHLR